MRHSLYFLGHRLHYKQNNASLKVFIDMEHDETTSKLSLAYKFKQKKVITFEISKEQI